MDDFQQTLDKFHVPQPEQEELKAIVESTRDVIVVAPFHEGPETTTCKCLRTYHPLLENITRVRLAFGENETGLLLGLTEIILGLAENSLRTSGGARIP